MFGAVKSGFSVGSGDVLKINVCDVRAVPRADNVQEPVLTGPPDWSRVNTSQTGSQINGVNHNGTILDYNNPAFQGSVETAVQKYLSEHGGDLLRELAHSHRICCCTGDHAQRRSPEEFISHNGRSPEEFISHSGDTVMERAVVSSEVVAGSDSAVVHNNVLRSSVVVQPDSTENSISEINAPFLNVDQVPGNDINREDTPSLSTAGRSRKLDELSPYSSNKRLKAMLGDQEYLLAPGQNTKLTVIPGQTLTSSWTLVTKHGISSRWDVVDDGGTLPYIGHVTWSPSSTPNIITLSADFTAPAQEGQFNSTWCLVQDGLRREVFVFCCVRVHNGPLRGSGGGVLAAHGNIPVETSVPKLLNSNKVFCLSRDEAYRSNENNNI